MINRVHRLLRVLAAWVLCFACQAQPALPGTVSSGTPNGLPTLRVVGGLSDLYQYTRLEEPFWTTRLTQLSHGKYHADIVPFDRAGIPGQDMLRLMELGVLPFGTALLSNVAAQNPDLAAPDLAGLNPDIASLRRNLAAYRPYLEKTLRQQHGIKLLAIYTYPAQVLFCKDKMRDLADLAGRRVRVSSATQADFILGLGATPVLISMAQLTENLKSGNVSCAITAAMTGNTLGVQQQTHYLHAMPITWGLSIFGANLRTWEALPADLRSILALNMPRLEDAIWEESGHETVEGVACNLGTSDCQRGTTGDMSAVPVSPQDEQQRKSLFTSAVLLRWLQRCGSRCNDLWNQTIGVTSGTRAPANP